MSASVVQELSNDSAGGGGTLTKAGTFTAGNGIRVSSTWGNNSAAPSCSDGHTSPTATDSHFDSNVGQSTCQFTFNNSPGGSLTFTLTFTGTPTFTGIHIEEIGTVTTTAADGHNTNSQTFPGTGTDAVTSNAVSNVNQPALLVGTGCEFGGSVPNTGTGFTTGTTFWGFGGAGLARSESKRITNTTGTAATFTSTTATATTAFAAMFDESSGVTFQPAWANRQVIIGSGLI